MAYYVGLTEEQMDRLTTIVACHIDLNIGEKIKQEMKRGNSLAVERLINTKNQDSDILSKLLNSSKTK